MIEQFIYQDSELPEHIRWQVLSFTRVQWPDGFVGKNQFREWIHHQEDHPVHFVLTAGDLLVSYVGVVWKYLEHAGERYKTYGFSGVFTYPSFRHQGHGSRLVQEAKEYMEQQEDADIVLFPSIQKEFYEDLGFERLKDAKLLEGDPRNPKIYPENVFMLFLSEKGKAHRSDFETKPIYFGEAVW